MEQFYNRTKELSELDGFAGKAGLIVIYGRRRIGKTRLIKEWLKKHSGSYSQAVEASSAVQIGQVIADCQDRIKFTIPPKNWFEFFELLGEQSFTLCLDEFPYLVASDPALPSIIQKWLDHKRTRRQTLVLSGSSTNMMYSSVLSKSAPLYGRADRILKLEPLSYEVFCQAKKIKPDKRESFRLFALVGGIPRYWEWIDPHISIIENAEKLFFNASPFMEDEPRRLLKDEQIEGVLPLYLLEAIGRGASRGSEIAGKVGALQANLSRPLSLLQDLFLIERELPHGFSARDTKRSLYTIKDPALKFWFGTYSPHRSRWSGYPLALKETLLEEHISNVFEEFCREKFPGMQRYWEKDLEIDGIVNVQGEQTVIEVKWGKLTTTESKKISDDLKQKFQTSKVKKARKVNFLVLSPESVLK